MPQLESLTLHSSDPSIFKWRRLLWRWLLLLHGGDANPQGKSTEGNALKMSKALIWLLLLFQKTLFFSLNGWQPFRTQDKKPFWVDESMVHLCARKVILLLFKINCITLCYFLHCCPKIPFWPNFTFRVIFTPILKGNFDYFTHKSVKLRLV